MCIVLTNINLHKMNAGDQHPAYAMTINSCFHLTLYLLFLSTTQLTHHRYQIQFRLTPYPKECFKSFISQCSSFYY